MDSSKKNSSNKKENRKIVENIPLIKNDSPGH